MTNNCDGDCENCMRWDCPVQDELFSREEAEKMIIKKDCDGDCENCSGCSNDNKGK